MDVTMINLDTFAEDIRSLNIPQLELMRHALYAELDAQRTIQTAPTVVESLQRQVHAAQGGDGREWAQPAGAHDAVPAGAVVHRGLGYWRATGPTAHEPGSLNAPWERVWPTADAGWTAVDPNGPREWDPEATYRQPVTVIRAGRVFRLKHTHSLPGWDPLDPAMHAVWEEQA